MRAGSKRSRYLVSIHALTRSATHLWERNPSPEDVSIHALTRSATRIKINKPASERFQSTHSRGVRLGLSLIVLYFASVSIHALTRSATLWSFSNFLISCCFNPRTHEECDLGFAQMLFRLVGFNPRTHEECDRKARRG